MIAESEYLRTLKSSVVIVSTGNCPVFSSIDGFEIGSAYVSRK